MIRSPNAKVTIRTVQKKIRLGYMCAVDYDYHLEMDPGGAEVYPSMKSLHRHSPCIKGCGYVTVKIVETHRSRSKY